jgi:hypothetical protein
VELTVKHGVLVRIGAGLVFSGGIGVVLRPSKEPGAVHCFDVLLNNKIVSINKIFLEVISAG